MLQAVHAPLEVPMSYVTDTECMFMPSHHRALFCGMMKVLDEVWLKSVVLAND